MDEKPLEQREDHERAGVADVDRPVDRRSAGVDADRPGSRGSSGAHRAGARVVQARSCAWCGNPSRSLGATRSGPEPIGCPPCLRMRPHAAAAGGGREGVQIAARALSRGRSGLRRHLSDPPRRPRSHLGGPLHQHGARVRKGGTRRDARRRHVDRRRRRGCALRNGELSGIDAFTSAGADGHAATSTTPIAFEGMFRLPGGRPPLLRIRDVPVGRHRISTLTMGAGPDVLLLHGLGGTRASLLETAAALSRATASTPSTCPASAPRASRRAARYNARWFADIMLGLMDELGDRARARGRQLDGRPDRASRWRSTAPERVGALGLLCPAVAWIKRGFHPIVRLLRPEFGMLPHGFSRKHGGLAVLEHVPRPRSDRSRGRRPDGRRVPPHLPLAGRALRVSRLAPATSTSRRRTAAAASTRAWPSCEPPALFIWGSHDPLVPAAFGRHVRQWLPTAEQVTLERLRPRAAGRAPGGDERAAAAASSPARSAEPRAPARRGRLDAACGRRAA